MFISVLYRLTGLQMCSLVFAQFTSTPVAQSDEYITEERPPNFAIEFVEDYRMKAPPKLNGSPAIVEVQIHPWKIGDISVEQMTFEVDVYFTIRWKDYRLKFSGVEGVAPQQMIPFDEDEAEKIWKPVVNFRNVMGSKGLTFEPDFFPLRIMEKEKIFYLLRKVEKFHCNFDLTLYPMDTQICFIEIQAFSYKSAVVLRDETRVHELRGGTAPPQFYVSSLSSGNCTRKDGASAFYSCVEFKFVLHRLIAHHLMLTYIPSILIVTLSWISFWLDVDATPARVGLGLTSLLTLSTQFSNAQKNLPPVAYVKALDVWMFSCIFTVFGSIVEFGMANFIARRARLADVMTVKKIQVPTKAPKPTMKMNLLSAIKSNPIDGIARFVFPVSFLIFNFCYWIYYSRW